VGGERTPSDALVGPVAASSLRSFHLDNVFMGGHGVHERSGFTTPNLLEADTNKTFADNTDQLVVLADHTKWGVTGLATICRLEDAAVCVTDDGLSDDATETLRSRVGRLIMTSPDLLDESRSA
jgi:DeoR/GlpR family transcriptional regulator of sugar metabolism